MIWLIGPKRLSNMRLHVAPATIGDTTVGSNRSATKICRQGIRSRNNCAIISPSTSSTGSAINVKIAV